MSKIIPSPKCEAAAMLRTLAGALPDQRFDLIRRANILAERLEGRPSTSVMVARRLAKRQYEARA